MYLTDFYFIYFAKNTIKHVK